MAQYKQAATDRPMQCPRLNVKKRERVLTPAITTDINWINLQPDNRGSFGIQLYRSDFAQWTTLALKHFFSHFGTVINVHIDKTGRYVYIRFVEREEAYNAMICLKRICSANPALNQKSKSECGQYPLYVQIMNTNFTAADLIQTFEPFSPVRVIPCRNIKCAYIVYLSFTWSADSVIKRFAEGDHPFKISQEDPHIGRPQLRHPTVDTKEDNQLVFDLSVTISNNGQREITETTNVVCLNQKTYDISLSHVLNNKYIRRETLQAIYKECHGVHESLEPIEVNTQVRIICKESYHAVLWGIVVPEGADMDRINERSRVLRKTLHFLRDSGTLEEMNSPNGRCGALIDGELHRAYLVDQEERTVFLVDEGGVQSAERLWELPEFVWTEAHGLRPFIVRDGGVWQRYRRDEAMWVRVGHRFPAPEDHLLTVE